MKEEFNIAAILNDKPEGTKLWSSIFGECTFDRINWDGSCFYTKRKGGLRELFYANGKYNKNGECIIFPSKQMKDWSKFAWKKGDVLAPVSDSNIHVLFMDWASKDYTRFRCKEEECLVELENDTRDFVSVSDEEAQKVIKNLEESYGGKLNLETLQIEKKQEFKDGDILYVEKNKLFPSYVFIYQDNEDNDSEDVCCYARYNCENCRVNICGAVTIDNRNIRLATKEEKEELLEHLKMEDKCWNPDTKTIEDLSEKCEFKAFDKVLVRNGVDGPWNASIYNRYAEDWDSHHLCIGGFWDQCIPYNEETAHLLGTTDEYKPKNK